MGHVRLGTLPQSGRWRDVISLIGEGADASEVAEAAAYAAQTQLKRMPDDPVFVHVAQLLVKLPLHARSTEYQTELAVLGFNRSPTSVTELLAGLKRSIDRVAAQSPSRNDAGEIAASSLLEALSTGLADRVPGLFETTSTDVRRGLAAFAGGDAFGKLARDFFARTVYRSLDYYLSRELANHQGPGQRFADDRERRQFQSDLSEHAFEASLIVKKFAGDWYGKTVWRDGSLDDAAIDRFTRYSFTKLMSELRRRSAAP